MLFKISDVQIQRIRKLGATNSINTYSKTKTSPHTTQIINLKYISIDFVALNQTLKYTFSIILRLVVILFKMGLLTLT